MLPESRFASCVRITLLEAPMNFVQFHIGDWDSSTRLLSPLEKGIYIDLIFLYYSLERPLMRSECDRIARAYTDEEKRALEYILERFFIVDGDVYRHLRCDKEIKNTWSKSAKAAASAKARWDRQKANEARKAGDASNTPNECKSDASAMRTQVQTESERNADGILTDNRKPISIKDVSNETSSSISPTLALDGEPDAPKRAPSVPFSRIVSIYNEKLGSELGVCRQLNKKREGNLRQRWADIARIVESNDTKEVLEGFAAFYDKIGRSNFLMGRVAGCDFRATFDWIHNSTNFLKIYEGNYENGRKR